MKTENNILINTNPVRAYQQQFPLDFLTAFSLFEEAV